MDVFERDFRVLVGEDAEDFVGEGLADFGDGFEVEDDGGEAVDAGEDAAG